ncbi:hypothetical protein [Bacillus coahuilensis]|uniref:hypothetical protein n=1 Tax=Bacillus coahuilensis TaxID=408580 RepID=UPI00018507D3|nr:hypothetical protein [Bacillus coahuilensis]
MKKEDLVEVIKALDQVEGTSVTFQSVWNNPRSHEWVFRLKRSVQVSVLLIVFIGVFVPLTYSFIHKSIK